MNLVSQYAPNQTVIETNDSIYLQSYKSIVARYDKQGEYVHLGVDWDYSRTTLKYLKRFLVQVNPCLASNGENYSKYNLSKKDIVNALEHSWLIGMNISKDNPQAHYEKA
tara:strand:- start:64 stop:393 length:330 start_codon:yes stop_codon:yes gene_type:complete